MLKIVVLIPIPSPRQRMPTAANPLVAPQAADGETNLAKQHHSWDGGTGMLVSPVDPSTWATLAISCCAEKGFDRNA